MQVEDIMSPGADTLPDHIDYINYGNALDYFENSNLASYPYDLSLFDDVVSFLSKKRQPDKYASLILRKYTKNNKTNVKLLKASVDNSLKYRSSFRKLKCRGFSYTLINRFDFCDELHSRANLRFMLMGSRDIFYPPRIRRYLQRVNNVHFRTGGFPAIAFAVGIEEETKWYLCTLQSDLFFRNSYIRDHIRGWQRILFSLIVNKANRENVQLFLPRSCDIINACYPPEFKPKELPLIWYDIYDHTAKYFNMKFVKLPKGINCQVVKEGEPVYIDNFYRLSPY